MASTIDGKIDGSALRDIMRHGKYEALQLPGIDGRHQIPAVFGGVSVTKYAAVPLKLKFVERREGDPLWIRYDVDRR
jgi:hypothetical protein